jgi:hypothetical protein
MVMEIRFILLVATLFVSLPATTYAAKKESGKDDSVSGLYLKDTKSNSSKPNQDNNKPVKSNDSKPKQDDNKSVKSDDSKSGHGDEKIVANDKFEDELKNLIKGQEDPHDILHICNKDKDDKIEIDNGHHEKPNVNTVPIPAAVWLFGSSLLGLFCHKRKKA